MHAYFLPSHVYCSETPDGAVLLDLRTQRYIAVSAAQVERIRPLIQNWPANHSGTRSIPPTITPAVSRLIASLQSQTLLTGDPPLSRAIADISLSAPQPVNAMQAMDILAARVTLSHAVQVVVASARASYQLRTRSLQQIVQRLRDRKAARPAQLDSEGGRQIRALASTFAWLRPLVFSHPPICLLDSLTLLEFLAQHGYHALWILGVSSPPFRAHSWVQLDGTVLNDTLERAATYHPILAV